ncbi:hypothetical protein Misp01_64650 [Microtetraspora sp. NBRC 13810]|uniref:hypothetical protein n=1 Tax=Microtetraspora sp. NBRC 13810 TaxID=3030990 RepID=UPI0024A5F5BA|nr:hypothetical protein [Microtetraspora sp. NBRC 13810]GLW11337.1 hypothetical protein Misp01_64650 [Microtetraspora sp. NBRC 13810]
MSPSGRRFLVAAVLVAAILLTALSVHALWAPWSGGTRPASDSVPRGAVTLTGGTAHDVVTLTVSAPVTGVTAVDVRVVARNAAVRSSPVVTVSAVLPTAGHAVPDLPAIRVSDNSYHVAGLPLMMPGRWEFLVAVDGDGRRDRLVFPLTVSP